MKLLKKGKRQGYLLLVLFVVLTGCFAGCAMQKSSSSAGTGSAEISEDGMYTAVSDNGYPLSLTFKDGKFHFYDYASSNWAPDNGDAYGTYSVEGNTVNLISDNAKSKFILTISGDKLYLDTDNSSKLSVINGQHLDRMFTGEVCFVFSRYQEESTNDK